MDKGQVSFLDFPTLLHFAKKGGVLFASSNEQETGGFAVEPTDEGEKLLRIVISQPVDQRESAVGPSGVDQPAGRFVDDEKVPMFLNDGRNHKIKIL